MAKRVNKQFLWILVAVVCGLALTAGGGYYYVKRMHHNAEYYRQKGAEALAAGRLMEARDDYGAAVSKEPSNCDNYMLLADMDERLAAQDQTFLTQARGVWA